MLKKMYLPLTLSVSISTIVCSTWGRQKVTVGTHFSSLPRPVKLGSGSTFTIVRKRVSLARPAQSLLLVHTKYWPLVCPKTSIFRRELQVTAERELTISWRDHNSALSWPWQQNIQADLQLSASWPIGFTMRRLDSCHIPHFPVKFKLLTTDVSFLYLGSMPVIWQ